MAEDDGRSRALGVAGRLARLSGSIDPADGLVGVQRTGIDASEIVEARAPGEVLGKRPHAGLLQTAQCLVESRPKRPIDGHDLAGRLHLAAEGPVRARELVEREARQLDHDIVKCGLEGGDRRAGHDVRDLGEPAADRDLCCDAGDRVARRLRCQGGAPTDARIDLDDGVLGRVRREGELDVAATLHAQCPDDRQGCAPQALVDGVGQRLDRRDDDRVAGVDAERIDVLHGADRDARVIGVAHDLVLDLLPADQALLDHDLADRARPQAGPDALAVGRLGLDDATPRAAKGERRADDGRQADGREGLVGQCLSGRRRRTLDDEARGVGLADPIEQIAEGLAILGHPDRLQGRAQEPDVVTFEDARIGHRDREIEGGLPAQAGEQPIRSFPGDDRLHRLHREWLQVDDVGDRGVGHDRGRVRVDEDRPDALGAESAASLRAGIVELGGLADDDGSAAQDQDRGGLWRRRGLRRWGGHRCPAAAATNRSKTANASSGPGAPSGWYWTVSIGSSRWRSPSTERSLRLI